MCLCDSTLKPGGLHTVSAGVVAISVLVAEVTQPSLGVGYEIGRAVEHQKRVLCLFRKESGQSEHCPATVAIDTTQPSIPLPSPPLPCPLPSPADLSAMVRGAEGALTVVDYTSELELDKVLEDYFAKLNKQ